MGRVLGVGRGRCELVSRGGARGGITKGFCGSANSGRRADRFAFLLNMIPSRLGDICAVTSNDRRGVYRSVRSRTLLGGAMLSLAGKSRATAGGARDSVLPLRWAQCD